MEGMTALMLASQRGHAAIAEILINAGALVDKQTVALLSCVLRCYKYFLFYVETRKYCTLASCETWSRGSNQNITKCRSGYVFER
jgi:hypothetical protein